MAATYEYKLTNREPLQVAETLANSYAADGWRVVNISIMSNWKRTGQDCILLLERVRPLNPDQTYLIKDK